MNNGQTRASMILMAAAAAIMVLAGGAMSSGQCGTTPPPAVASADVPVAATGDYSAVLSQGRRTGITFGDLPGFTRSVYKRDHALITPESRVWAAQPGWKNSLTTHLITPAGHHVGANFAMLLADMKAGGEAGRPAPGAERFALVLEGALTMTQSDGRKIELKQNDFIYLPPNDTSSLTSSAGAGLVIYERLYALSGKPILSHGNVEASPLLPSAGEVFDLRKLLPQTADHDFNVHVMDFKPGEFLYVKEVHYNQHGLLLVEGQGIYRLADSWYPVQAGDAIWMAPFVPQWYAALGTKSSRYILYKDTTMDPLVG